MFTTIIAIRIGLIFIGVFIQIKNVPSCNTHSLLVKLTMAAIAGGIVYIAIRTIAGQ